MRHEDWEVVSRAQVALTPKGRVVEPGSACAPGVDAEKVLTMPRALRRPRSAYLRTNTRVVPWIHASTSCTRRHEESS